MSVYLSLPAALLLVAGLASAASAQPGNHPPVADPATPVPSLQYQSVFAAPMAAPAKTGWREANDRVLATGGHGGALKEDAAPPARPMMQHQMHRDPMPMQHQHQHQERQP